MSADLVICDVLKKGDFTELATEIALGAGLNPIVVGRTTEAQDALGYFTAGLVSTVGWHNGFKPEEHEGIMLLSMADILEVPKAVIDDKNVDEKVMRYMREGDIILPRNDMDTVEQRLGKWLYRLANKS